MSKLINNVSDGVLKKPDLLEREKLILDDIQKRTGFVPDRRLGDSRYWTSDYAGAVFYRGKYRGQPTVLKIQGVKLPVSEIDQINNFNTQNQSRIIRPPKLYGFLRWNEINRYEALFLEDIQTKPVVSSPATAKQLEEFFRLYREYRQNCLITPWLPEPKLSLSQMIENDFNAWRQIAKNLYPSHPLKNPKDEALIETAVTKLRTEYKTIEPQFMHGHWSVKDVVKNTKGEVIIFSNLYWKYKAPFYDACFGWHWFRYQLAKIKGISASEIEAQKELWLEQINNLAKSDADRKLIKLALLERAAAGLNLDALSLDQKAPMAEYLVEMTRREVIQLLKFR